jgi:hypothetical protein
MKRDNITLDKPDEALAWLLDYRAYWEETAGKSHADNCARRMYAELRKKDDDPGEVVRGEFKAETGVAL